MRTIYLEVILPIAIDGTLHYTLNLEDAGLDLRGYRVLVPLGKKRYTGVVRSMSLTAPSEIDPIKLRPIEAILDDKPLIGLDMLRLWDWVSDYYITPLGVVMAKAMPLQLRLSSTTLIRLNEDFIAQTKLKPSLLEILYLLESNPQKMLAQGELEKKLGQPLYKRMQELLLLGAISTEEVLRERIKTVQRKQIYLSSSLLEAAPAEELFSTLKRAPKQYKLLLEIYQLLQETGDPLKGIERKKILKRYPNSVGSLRILIKKGYLVEQLEEVRYNLESLIKNFPIEDVESIQKDKSLSGVVAAAITEKTSPHTVLLWVDQPSELLQAQLDLIEGRLLQGEIVMILSPTIDREGERSALIKAIKSRFNTYPIYSYHRFTAERDRTVLYKECRGLDGPAILLGTKNALFLPFSRAPFILIEEEESSLYKDNYSAPKIHARDLAIMRSFYTNSPVVLSSSTPSLESIFNAVRGKYRLFDYSTGALKESLKNIELLDLNTFKEKRLINHAQPITPPLQQQISDTLQEGNSVLILHNRIGYAPYLACRQCQTALMCSECHTSLNYHADSKKLHCHWCGREQLLPRECPHCLEPYHKQYGDQFVMLGAGLERVEESLSKLYPDTPIIRIDSYSIENRQSLLELNYTLQEEEPKIIISTALINQEAIKLNVALFAVLELESLLSYPDFRTAEKAMQLLHQLLFRVQKQGTLSKLIIQTYKPDQPFVRSLLSKDYKIFSKIELKERESFHFPPFYRLTKVILRHLHKKSLALSAKRVYTLLSQTLGSELVSPPIETYQYRINGAYQEEIVLRRPYAASYQDERKAIQRALTLFEQQFGKEHKLSISFDVDPID